MGFAAAPRPRSQPRAGAAARVASAVTFPPAGERLWRKSKKICVRKTREGKVTAGGCTTSWQAAVSREGAGIRGDAHAPEGKLSARYGATV